MNVIVIAAHGLNCHWLGPYGNEWVRTPTFDSLAPESIIFDWHFAHCPSPLESPDAMLEETLTALRLARVATALVDDRRQRTGENRLWQFSFATELASHPTPGDALLATMKTAIEKLARHTSWLLWVETDRFVPPWDFEYETYQQYAESSGGFIEERSTEGEEPIDVPAAGPIDPADDPFWHRLHNSFAAAVTSFDAEVGALSDLFRKRRLDQSAAWIFTSGYGWPLGEHGIVGPEGSRLHEELVHLPLIVRLPGGRGAMRRIGAFTQPPDIGPTLLDLFGVPPSTPSLAPLMSGNATGLRDACRISTNHGDRALRTRDWAYLAEADGEPARLYRKPDDIWEVNDLSLRYPDDCDQLLAMLNQREQK